jgi:hypothetical protein
MALATAELRTNLHAALDNAWRAVGSFQHRAATFLDPRFKGGDEHVARRIAAEVEVLASVVVVS